MWGKAKNLEDDRRRDAIRSKFKNPGKAAVAGSVASSIGELLDELKCPESMSIGTINGIESMSAEDLFEETYKRALKSIINSLQSELSGITKCQ